MTIGGNYIPIPNVQQLFFLGFATFAILGSVLMITRRNAVHSALLLVIVFFQIAGVYVLLGAEFLAALQVLVYTGAILVLFLFVIMLLQLREAPQLRAVHRWQQFVAPLLGLLLVLEFLGIIFFGGVTLSGVPHQAPAPATVVEIAAAGGSPRALGQVLYTIFLLPFEVASFILLVAVIGAIVLARREEPADVERLVPFRGISLGRGSIAGSSQAEQLEKVRADVTTPITVVGGERQTVATSPASRTED